MPVRPLLLLLLALFLAAPSRAEIAATVALDAILLPGGEPPSERPFPNVPASWLRWARMEGGAPLVPVIAPASALSGRAARFPGGLGLLLTNTAGEPVRVRIEATVPAGLWRVDAAARDGNGEGAAARTWRMESALRPKPGLLSKSVLLPPGQTLLLRVTETVAGAEAASAAATAAKNAASADFLRAEVERALEPVAGAIAALAALVRGGDRGKIATRAHRALLAVAGAQVLWKNGRPDDLAAQDAAFDDLMTALSEVSLAACNLVPSQTEIVGADGKRSLRVGVVNAGSRTVPVVALGLRQAGDGPSGAEPADAKVYAALVPGETVSATFADESGAGRGVVQFILGMGAAVVPASPLP